MLKHIGVRLMVASTTAACSNGWQDFGAAQQAKRDREVAQQTQTVTERFYQDKLTTDLIGFEIGWSAPLD
jgi:hypothetical protein